MLEAIARKRREDWLYRQDRKSHLAAVKLSDGGGRRTIYSSCEQLEDP
jgi:hypothetical protein